VPPVVFGFWGWGGGDMTDFQEMLIEKSKVVLESIVGQEIDFKNVIGKKESYYYTTCNIKNYSVEVYVYEEEAGFMINGNNWTICEKPDYDSEEKLLESFLEKLRNIGN
jgi:hypothetical protein